MKTNRFFLLLLVCLLSGQGRAKDVESWSVQLSGMTHYIRYSDFNDMVNSINAGMVSDGTPRLDKIKLTSGLDLECFFRMNRFQFGFGIGYQMIPDVEYVDGDTAFTTLIEDYELKHKVSTKVVSVICAYDILSLSNFTFYGGAGIAYYLTSISFYNRQYGDLNGNSSTSVMTRTTDSNLSSNNFGLKGLMGVEAKLTSRLSLDVRFNIRYAALKGFMGTQTFHEIKETIAGNTYVTDEEYGAYLVRQEPEPGQVEFGASPDRALGTYEHQEGVVNLSGYGLQVGLKIHFPQ